MATFFRSDHSILGPSTVDTSNGSFDITGASSFTSNTIANARIDSSGSLLLGSTDAALVTLGNTANATDVNILSGGTIDVGDSNATTTTIEGATAVNVGNTNAVSIVIGNTANNTNVDVLSGGTIDVGSASATTVTVEGSTAVNIGNTNAASIVVGNVANNTNIDVLSGGTIDVGDSNATTVTVDGSTAVNVGSTSAASVVIGNTVNNTNVDILSGGTIDVGSSSASTVTIEGSTAINMGQTAGVPVSIGNTTGALDLDGSTVNMTSATASTLDAGTSMSIGESTAASVGIGRTAATMDIDGSTVDIEAVTTMNLGSVTATSIVMGNTVNTTAVDILSGGTIDVGSSSATTVTIEGSTAVNVGQTSGAAVSIGNASGALAMDGSVVTLDGTTSVSIGTTNVGIPISIGNAVSEVTINDNLTVTGNLTVNGDTTTISSSNLNVSDNHILLNDGYILEPAKGGCIVVNIDPSPGTATESITGFTAADGATAGGIITVASTTGFSVNDYVIIAGSNDQTNDGVYEIAKIVLDTSIEVAGVAVGATAPLDTGVFVQTNFVTDAIAGGTVVHTKLSILQTTGEGVWQTGVGDSAPIAFTSLTTEPGDEVIIASTDNGTTTDVISTSAKYSYIDVNDVGAGARVARLTLADGSSRSQEKTILLRSGLGASPVAEVTDVTAVPQASISDADFFWLFTDTTSHYFWFDVTTGAVDPAPSAPAGAPVTTSGHEVAIDADTTADDVALTLRGVIDGLGDFSAPVPGASTVTVTHAAARSVRDVEDGSAPTGFTLTVTTQGVSTGSSAGPHAEVKVANYLSASGSVGTQSLRFTRSGQSVNLTWNGLQWMCVNAGAEVITASF
jgi:hypothetical protein